jgi:hypothetical protein
MSQGPPNVVTVSRPGTTGPANTHVQATVKVAGETAVNDPNHQFKTLKILGTTGASIADPNHQIKTVQSPGTTGNQLKTVAVN